MLFRSERLHHIAQNEQIVLSDDAATLLARQAQGGMRDAIGLLELCGAGGAEVSADQVQNILGLSGYDAAAKALTYVAQENISALFGIVAEVVSSAKDISVYWQELLSFVRDMLICKYAENAAAYLDLTAQEMETLSATAAQFTMPRLIHICGLLDEAAAKMVRVPATKRMTAELALLKMCRPQLDVSPEALAARVSALEDKLALLDMGASVARPQQNIPKEDPVREEIPTDKPVKEEAAHSAPSTNEPTLENVRDISEALSRLDDSHKSLAGFLSQADISTSADGQTLYIAAEGFAAAMLGQPDAKEAIAQAFALAKITDGKAAVTVKTKAAAAKHAADEIGKLL